MYDFLKVKRFSRTLS